MSANPLKKQGDFQGFKPHLHRGIQGFQRPLAHVQAGWPAQQAALNTAGFQEQAGRMRYPKSSRRSTSRLQIYPVAPVTNMRLSFSFPIENFRLCVRESTIAIFIPLILALLG